MAVISIALTALGFTIAWRMDSTHGFHAVMSVFLLPMWLLSGAFFPGTGNSWLAWIVRLNPLTYGVAGLRHYLQFAHTAETASGGGLAPGSATISPPIDGLPPLSVCWIVTLAFATAMLLAAWKISASRTAGDLK
jgi:ABC-2 type transport system permease protein